MTAPESGDPSDRDARRLWLAILVVIVVWGAAIAIFGYAGLIIPAVGLTFAIFGALAVMMRG